jgi:hypothetical protein
VAPQTCPVDIVVVYKVDRLTRAQVAGRYVVRS